MLAPPAQSFAVRLAALPLWLGAVGLVLVLAISGWRISWRVAYGDEPEFRYLTLVLQGARQGVAPALLDAPSRPDWLEARRRLVDLARISGSEVFILLWRNDHLVAPLSSRPLSLLPALEGEALFIDALRAGKPFRQELSLEGRRQALVCEAGRSPQGRFHYWCAMQPANALHGWLFSGWFDLLLILGLSSVLLASAVWQYRRLRQEWQLRLADEKRRVAHLEHELSWLNQRLTTLTAEPPAEPVQRVCKVLVVDDDAFSLRIISRLLEKRGLSVAVADNGEVALARLTAEAFDLVFMDVQMPVLDGPAACERWRAQEQREAMQAVPIVALTASGSERERCLSAGMNEVLTKPVDVAALAQVLARYLPRSFSK